MCATNIACVRQKLYKIVGVLYGVHLTEIIVSFNSEPMFPESKPSCSVDQ